MSMRESYGKILVVDPNVFFVKRLAQALAEHGYEVVHCSEAAYALTMIEWNMPVAILCSIYSHNSNGFDIPSILQADSSTRHIPVVAIGDRGRLSHLEALRAGYMDFVDRRLGADEIVSHLLSLLLSLKKGFQPIQMLDNAKTTLDGHLSLVDLPGVMQMLEQCKQTGALHINSKTSDGIIFFEAGVVVHAESGNLVGNDAVMHLVKECHDDRNGSYRFMEGNVPTMRTVQGGLTPLILGALYELDHDKSATQPQVDVGKPANQEEPGATQAEACPANPQEVCDQVPPSGSPVPDMELENVQSGVREGQP